MKNSGFSGVLTVIIVIVLIARIAMISSRKSNSANPGWDNSFLLWSIFVLVAIIGAYIYNTSKSKNDQGKGH